MDVLQLSTSGKRALGTACSRRSVPVEPAAIFVLVRGVARTPLTDQTYQIYTSQLIMRLSLNNTRSLSQCDAVHTSLQRHRLSHTVERLM